MFFQCFFIFSPLCSCVGQALLARIKIVSVTAFFLMKNVLRHGREKTNGNMINNSITGFTQQVVVKSNHELS